ncbi:hypothetical protein [Eisenibacter elegans]|jgi:hypothetical protein|uniref:hypothetical protein n=1 Tax=Eisenibacter elegans TaxID=997 RepID=UPI0012B57D70|nr:hypothetical protein [Eisenibacter elegans]
MKEGEMLFGKWAMFQAKPVGEMYLLKILENQEDKIQRILKSTKPWDTLLGCLQVNKFLPKDHSPSDGLGCYKCAL